MNHPDSLPIDVEEIRVWANAHREERALSWSHFASLSGIPAGTLQPFCKGNYQGDNAAKARDLFRYRQTVESQRDRSIGIPTDPGFIETGTAKRFLTLLGHAQALKRIVVAGTGPGTGKTRAIRHYQACNANVWVATMKQSTRSLNNMIFEVAKAVGQPLKYQSSAGGSRQIMDAVRSARGLIVVDEVNHLETDAIEEIRSWNDETGVGIALFGNEEFLSRIKSRGRGRHALARLDSRIAARIEQDLPREDDAVVFLDAWGIEDVAVRKLLTEVALSPAHGGLRDVAMTIEFASMLAMDDGTALALSHVRDAHNARTTRLLRI